MASFRKYDRFEMAAYALARGASPYIALKAGRGCWFVRHITGEIMGTAKRRKGAEALRDDLTERGVTP